MKKINVTDFEKELTGGSEAQVVDVREPAEYASEHLKASTLVSLSNINADALKIFSKVKPLYVLCRSGNRSCKAADRFEAMGFGDVRVLEGGLKSWIEAGKPVERGSSKIWSLDRQVRFAAGTLVLAGVFLSWRVHPYWLGLSAFVGAGLVFSGVTDFCGMAMLLARMPWNQNKGTCSS